MRRDARLRFALALTLACTGCFAVVGFDDFDTSSSPSAPRDGGDDALGDFGLMFEPATVVVVPRGGSQTVTAHVEATAGFNEPVTITATQTPPSITVNPPTFSLVPGTSANLVIVATPTAPFGDSSITFVVRRGGIEHSATLPLHVTSATGQADETFGDGGVAALDATGATLNDCLVLPDDRVLALSAQVDVSGNARSLVVLLTADGLFDGTFGDGGVTQLDGVFGDVVASRDSETVVAGEPPLAPGEAVPKATWLVRLSDAGAVDPTYGANGAARLPYVGAVAGAFIGQKRDVQTAGIGSNGIPRIVHTDSTGALDTAFADGGVTEFPGVQVSDGRAALDPATGIVFGGSGPISPGAADVACKILEFGLNGEARHQAIIGRPGGCFFSDIAIAPGSIRALAGASGANAMVAAYDANGVPSLTMPDGVTPIPSVSEPFKAMALDATQRYVAVSVTRTGMQLARTTPDGRLDVTFGTGGTSPFSIFGKKLKVARLRLQSTGRILVCGTASDDTSQPFVARFKP